MNFRIGNVYNFHTKAASVLGLIVTNVTLKSIVDYETALAIDNITSKYRVIYPLLPNGTPDNPKDCVYYVFKSFDGQTLVYADQWIDENSIEQVDSIDLEIIINNITHNDITRVRDVLNALGFTDYGIRTI